MEIIENKEGIKSVLTVRLSKNDYQPAVEKELKKTRQTAQFRGFRPGSVPMSIIRKRYEAALCMEEIDKLIRDSLENYFKNDSRNLIGRVLPIDVPDLSLLESQTDQDILEFTFEAGFYPELDYQLNENTELPYYNIAVSDEDIDTTITNLRKQFGKIMPAETIEDNAFVFASFELDEPLADKVETETADAVEPVETAEVVEPVESAEPVAEGEAVEVIEEEESNKKDLVFMFEKVADEYKHLFRGAAAGGQLQLDVKLDKIFTNETDLRSMLNMSKEEIEQLPETLNLKINQVTGVEQAELNQEFFDRLSHAPDLVHSVDEAREYIRDENRKHYARLGLERLVSDFKLYMDDKIPVELPEDIIWKQVDYINSQKPDEQRLSDEDLKEQYIPYLDQLKWDFVRDTLLERANAELTKEDILVELKLRVTNIMSQYQYYGLNPEHVRDMVLSDEHEVAQLTSMAKEMLLAKLLKEQAKLNILDVSNEEYYKICQDELAEGDKLIDAAKRELEESARQIAEAGKLIAEAERELEETDKQIAEVEEKLAKQKKKIAETGKNLTEGEKEILEAMADAIAEAAALETEKETE